MEKRNMQCEGRKEEKNGEKAEGFSGVEGERDGAHRLRGRDCKEERERLRRIDRKKERD